MYVYICIYIYIGLCVCECVYTYICVCVCVYRDMCVCHRLLIHSNIYTVYFVDGNLLCVRTDLTYENSFKHTHSVSRISGQHTYKHTRPVIRPKSPIGLTGLTRTYVQTHPFHISYRWPEYLQTCPSRVWYTFLLASLSSFSRRRCLPLWL